MKKGIIVIVLLGMLGWTIYSFVFQSDHTESNQDLGELLDTSEEADGGNTTNENTVGLEIGNLAPDFQLKTLNEEEIALSDYRGSPVMINFWATWCPPCRAEMPDMESFYQDTDIEILAVNLTETEQSHNQVQRFVDEYELTFPILLDEVVTVATIYAIQPVPTSFIVDSEGIIQFKTFGPLTYDQMVQVLDGVE